MGIKKLRLLLGVLASVTVSASPTLVQAGEPCSPDDWCVVYELPRDHDGFLLRIWGSGPSDIFVAGKKTIVRFDGTSWSLQRNHSDSGIGGLAGSGPKDVYAVGSRRTIQRWNGTEWQLELRDKKSGLRRGGLGKIFVAGPGDVYALDAKLWHRVNDTWQEVPTRGSEPAWDTFERIRAKVLRAKGWPDYPTQCDRPTEMIEASTGYWIAHCSQGDRRRLFSYPARTPSKWKPLKVGVILAGASGTPDLLHVVLDGKLWRLSGATWSEINLKRRGQTNGLWSDGAWLYVVTSRAVLRARIGAP